jgi:hypothetical protein
MAISKPGVITKYVGASNSKGSRIKGTYTNSGASTNVAYEHGLSEPENHERLAERMLGTKSLVKTEHKPSGYIFIVR